MENVVLHECREGSASCRAALVRLRSKCEEIGSYTYVWKLISCGYIHRP